MAKPLRLLINLLSYNGVKPTNNPQDAIQIDKKVEESNTTAAARLQQVVPPSTTAMALSLASSAGPNDYLVILVDQPVTINLNGDATGIALNPKVPGYMTPVFMLRGAITSLTVSNASATVSANIDFTSVKI